MNTWINFKKLKSDLNFVAVLDYYGLKHNHKKQQDMISCPFHKDNDPSLSINKGKGIFRCFGCGVSGNILDFICEKENLDKNDTKDFSKAAAIAVENILGKNIEDFSHDKKQAAQKEKPVKSKRKAKKNQEKKSSDPPKKMKEKTKKKESKRNKALTFELQNLSNEHAFFDQRDINEETIELFGLGYCSRGIMKGRIVVPLHNMSGELIAYVGRWPEDETPDDTIRYKFPKGFKKSVELYNLHRALKLLEKKTDNEPRTMYVVEGFWSTMRLHQEGVPVVGAFGSELSEEQAQMLAEHVDIVVVVFDGDTAGREGSEKAVVLLSKFMLTRRVTLTEGEKPDTAHLDKILVV